MPSDPNLRRKPVYEREYTGEIIPGVARHSLRWHIYKQVHHIDAVDDIEQELYSRWHEMALWKKTITFPRAYAYKMASRLVYEWIRKYKRDAEGLKHYFDLDKVRAELHAKDVGDDLSLPAEVDHLLAVLSPQQRRAYVLQNFWGHSVKEIAGMMGIAPNTVKEHLGNALSRLSDLINQRWPELYENTSTELNARKDR